MNFLAQCMPQLGIGIAADNKTTLEAIVIYFFLSTNFVDWRMSRPYGSDQNFCRRQRLLFTALLTHLIAVFLNAHVVLFVKGVPLLLYLAAFFCVLTTAQSYEGQIWGLQLHISCILNAF